MVQSRLASCQFECLQRDNYRMIFQRLRETLYFFWHHLTPLLGRLLPLLPLLVVANYRLLTLHEGDPQKALKDGLVLLPELVAGVLAMALTLRYALAVVMKEDSAVAAVWRQSLRDLPALIVVQLLLGLLIGLPFFLLVMLGLRPDVALLLLGLPAFYLLGSLLPAYVIAVRERPGSIAALRAAWQRFRPSAWALSAGLASLMLLLLLVHGGLESLGKLIATSPLELRVAVASGLELIGLLFWQMITILLVRFYELEQAGPPKGGWN